MSIDLSPIRENSSVGIQHPTHLDGRSIWLDPEVQDITNRLHFGDPTLGWEGDERLAIYRADGRWELWRLEADGEYRMICRSRPGIGLDNRLILRLVERDSRRGYNAAEAIDANNERIVASVDSNSQAHHDQAADKLFWALRRDLG